MTLLPARRQPTPTTGAQPGLHSTITHLFGVPSTIIFRPEFRRGEATRTPRIGEAMRIEKVASRIVVAAPSLVFVAKLYTER
jgi:hypothetical protein